MNDQLSGSWGVMNAEALQNWKGHQLSSYAYMLGRRFKRPKPLYLLPDEALRRFERCKKLLDPVRDKWLGLPGLTLTFMAFMEEENYILLEKAP